MQSNKQRAPAYSGARFDINGYCISHSDVRLCRVTETGQYKIVCKTCFKCGSIALETDAHYQKINVHGYKKKNSAPREVPSNLFTTGGKNETSVSRGRGDDSRARSVPPSSRRRSSAASPNEEIISTKGMGSKPSISRSKSFSRRSSCPKLSREIIAHSKKVESSSRTVDGFSRSYPNISMECTTNTKKGGHNFDSSSSKKLDGLNKSCPKLSMESPKTTKAVRQLPVEALKQSIPALPSPPGGKHGDSGAIEGMKRSFHALSTTPSPVGRHGHSGCSPNTKKDLHQLALPNSSGGKVGDSSVVKQSPLTRRNRHQVDSKAIEGILALPNSPGVGKDGDSGLVGMSPNTRKDPRQLDNKTIETLKQSLQGLPNGREHKASKERESAVNSSTRNRMEPVEGQTNNNVGHHQDRTTGVEGRAQNLIALPNSTARLARRRSSMTQSFDNP